MFIISEKLTKFISLKSENKSQKTMLNKMAYGRNLVGHQKDFV